MIIAQIAYDQLSSAQKAKANRLVHGMDRVYKKSDFDHAATWPDTIKDQISAFNSWHFINQPYSDDGTPLPRVDKENVVWAIQKEHSGFQRLTFRAGFAAQVAIKI